MDRRKFIKYTAGLAAFPAIAPRQVIGAQGNKPAPSDCITLGFIGVGVQGSGLLRGFLHDDTARVLAICDVDSNKKERAQTMVDDYYSQRAAGKSTACRTYKDFRELLVRPDIDAVVIATPDHWHAIIAIQAAKAGKDIYCEKPMSLTIEEARAMVTAVRRYQRVFQTGSQQRSSYEFRFACELVQNGYIGDIERVEIGISCGFGTFPTVCTLPAEPVPEELDWDLWLGQAPYRPYNSDLAPPISFQGYPNWRRYRDYSCACMGDWGAHHFDIGQWALGMDKSGPVEIIPPVLAESKHLTYIYANGVPMYTDFDSNGVRFFGSKGKVEVNRGYLRTWPDSLVNQAIKPDEVHLYKSNDHKENWFNCIRDRSLPICDVEIGASTATVSHLGIIAHDLGRKIQWNPEKEKFINDDEANRLISRSMRSPWSLV
jgi:predicted dehydrogenase